MSYSTTLYAVDIGTLNAAVGSRDHSLLQRLRDACTPAQETPDETKLRGDVTLRITGDGRLFFNGQETTLDDLPNTILAIDSGSLEVVMEYPWTKQHEAAVLANNEDVPNSGLEKVITRWECDDPKISKTLCKDPQVTWSRNEEVEEEAGPFIPHFSVAQEALSDIIIGSLSGSGPEHGRALEVLCYVLGKRLPDEDLIGDLEPLALDTPLQQARSPIPLNQYSDFPVISYLSTDEVIAETQRLSKLDLSFPDDEDIEEAREALFECFDAAANNKLAIVAFYQ